MKHKSVLLNEILEGLEIKDGDVFVDMTLGGAGHTMAAAKLDANNLTVVGIDADHAAIDRANAAVEKFLATKKYQDKKHKFIFRNNYFDELEKIMDEEGIAKVDKVLFDLGYSSFEIDTKERGFSFKHDGPLKMTYTQNPLPSQLTAYDVVNSFAEENLADIIYGFGEETFSRRIARAIVEAREQAPIETSAQLAEIIKQSVPPFYRNRKIHPATKTFQAIRIAVNSELERLKIALKVSFEKLRPGGRIAVISFHSLEDRIVKKFFKEKTAEGLARLLTKKPITPAPEELQENPRSRSAKLRLIEKK